MKKRYFQILVMLWVLLLLACNYPTSTGPLSTTTTVDSPPEGSQIPTPLPAFQHYEQLGFGVETHNMNYPGRVDQLNEIGAKVIRRNAIFWSDIEPNEGDRNWNAAASLESELATMNQAGTNVVLIIRKTPVWARLVEDSECGPIKRESFLAFARFLQDAIARYTQAPFNVKYWELGNEPDVHVTNQGIPYGCWGDGSDDYYGGGYYAEMLKVAYPAIKAADPEAKVLIGGLLLDCDPENPPEGKDCKPARFFEGILRNGGGNFFDIVSFHGYPQYIGSLQLDENFPGWEHRGGVVLGKVDYLREVMAAYGIDKPLMHTEGGLICNEHNLEHCNPPGADFYEAQADYVVWMYVRNWAAGVSATIWYPLDGPGWRYGGLLDAEQNPKPAYHAYRFLSSQLKDSVLAGQVTQYPELLGYEFSALGKRTWVMWAPDEQPYEIALPAGVLQVYDKYGNVITPGDGRLIVNKPVYMEFASP